ESTKENPATTAETEKTNTVEERLTSIETGMTAIMSNLALLAQDKIEQKNSQKTEVAEHKSQILTIKELAAVQVTLMKPLLDTFKSGITVGRHVENAQVQLEYETERAEGAIDQLENIQKQLDAAARGKKIDFTKLAEEITPVVETVVNAFKK
ncbi:MAG: hypothetical protein GTO45_32915, partial [Candidatus Aminicenantes bacterium]|nr:hypothetical protein [Candidatus Aminicenantes bacterium]NIN22942.1 hypothetical protein [Candidatus Aminicenantes bacterium]NIN46679.1 hypothetical protein [Candidatus Aminicenantes bacterium]NIN89585.1 hypothetical protein [Candidatus Aminicenantes bacterium]NIO86133.1 hypothetical protein [Candidatus Aminicenantes bacterium]